MVRDWTTNEQNVEHLSSINGENQEERSKKDAEEEPFEFFPRQKMNKGLTSRKT
jgi:hypothetical protein